MGWKAIKAHYGIQHILARYEGEGWCIGSAYVHNLITIDTDLRRVTRSTLVRPSEELDTLIQRFHADGGAFWAMWDVPDVFDRSLPVFTTRDGVLVEAFCEERGWPNATHDGWLMYDNTYFAEPAHALAHGKRDAEASIRHIEERIAEWEADGARLRERLGEARGLLSSLEQEECSLAAAPTPTTNEDTP